MSETEYISVGFTLRWGDMRFLRACPDVFDSPQAIFDRVASDYSEGMIDNSPVTGNGIAVGRDVETGCLWFRAPETMHKVDTYKGFLYSVSKTSEDYTARIHFGFPVLIRECYVAGIWSISNQRMDRVRSLTHRFSTFNTLEKAEKTLLYHIDKLAADS